MEKGVSLVKINRRHLLTGAAAVGISTVTVTAQPGRAAAASLSTPFTPVNVPHLREAEQMVEYQRMLAAGLMTTGLVGHWPLDQTAGTTAADCSGFDHPASLGSAAGWSALRAGGELSFDGTSQAFAATAGPVLDTTGSFGVSAWVHLSATANPSNMYTAVSQDGAAGSRFLLQYDPAAGWAFKIRSEDETVRVSAVATTPAQLGAWTHLAGVFDGTQGSLQLYVNGVLEGSATTFDAWSATQGFNIGRAKFNGAPVNRWNGSIDDVRAYNRALSAAEVGIIAGARARQNNVYLVGAAPVVSWGQPSDLTSWIARARCSSFVTAVLKHSYSWASDEYFRTYFAGDSGPEAADYCQAFAGDPGPRFRRIRRVTDLMPGDLVAIDYLGSVTGSTGHIVMVRQVKGVYTGTGDVSGETQYAVEVLDCTADPHGVYGVGSYSSYPDTRMVDDITNFQGVGIGHMMFYASNATGEFSRYRWSVNTSSSSTYAVSQRPIAAARIA
jgi:hypothetical protein